MRISLAFEKKFVSARLNENFTGGKKMARSSVNSASHALTGNAIQQTRSSFYPHRLGWGVVQYIKKCQELGLTTQDHSKKIK